MAASLLFSIRIRQRMSRVMDWGFSWLARPGCSCERAPAPAFCPWPSPWSGRRLSSGGAALAVRAARGRLRRLGRSLSVLVRQGKLGLHVLVDAGDGRANLIQERPREDADHHDQDQERSHAGDFMPADRRDHVVIRRVIRQ